jgi:hypothetical protein
MAVLTVVVTVGVLLDELRSVVDDAATALFVKTVLAKIA